MNPGLVVASVIASATVAAVWSNYIDATARREPGRAGWSDLILSVSGSVVLQVWKMSESNFAVLLIADVAGAVGTYVAVRYLKARGT